MVNVIEDWDVLAVYAGEKLGFYSSSQTMEPSRLGYKLAGFDSEKNSDVGTMNYLMNR